MLKLKQLLFLITLHTLTLYSFSQDIFKTRAKEFSVLIDSIYSDTLFSRINVFGECSLRTENMMLEKVLIDKFSEKYDKPVLALFLKTSVINLIKSKLITYDEAIKNYYPLYQMELNYFKFFPNLDNYNIIPLELEYNPQLSVKALDLFFSKLTNNIPLLTYQRLKAQFDEKKTYKKSNHFIDSLNFYLNEVSPIWTNLRASDTLLQKYIVEIVEALNVSKKVSIAEEKYTTKAIAFANQSFKRYYSSKNVAAIFIPTHWLKSHLLDGLMFGSDPTYFVTRYLSSTKSNKEYCNVLKHFFKMKKRDRKKMVSKKFFSIQKNGVLMHSIGIGVFRN